MVKKKKDSVEKDGKELSNNMVKNQEKVVFQNSERNPNTNKESGLLCPENKSMQWLKITTAFSTCLQLENLIRVITVYFVDGSLSRQV